MGYEVHSTAPEPPVRGGGGHVDTAGGDRNVSRRISHPIHMAFSALSRVAVHSERMGGQRERRGRHRRGGRGATRGDGGSGERRGRRLGGGRERGGGARQTDAGGRGRTRALGNMSRRISHPIRMAFGALSRGRAAAVHSERMGGWGQRTRALGNMKRTATACVVTTRAAAAATARRRGAAQSAAGRAAGLVPSHRGAARGAARTARTGRRGVVGTLREALSDLPCGCIEAMRCIEREVGFETFETRWLRQAREGTA